MADTGIENGDSDTRTLREKIILKILVHKDFLVPNMKLLTFPPWRRKRPEYASLHPCPVPYSS